MLAEFSGFYEAKHFPKENEGRDAVTTKWHSPKGKRSAAIPNKFQLTNLQFQNVSHIFNYYMLKSCKIPATE